jgi:hypothetical protein
MTMLKTIATVAIGTVDISPAVEMNESPFLGGQGHNAILRQSAAIGGAGSVKVQGSNEIDEPAEGDASWTDIVTLTATTVPAQEIELYRWMRINVAVAGTAANTTFVVEGVQ